MQKLKSSPPQTIWVVAELFDDELYQVQAFSREALAKECREKIVNEYRDTNSGCHPSALSVEIYHMVVQR